MTKTKEIVKANDILLKFNITEENLPVDIDYILKRLNIDCYEVELPDNISGVLDTRSTKAIILVNKAHSESRKRFSKAHELGHYLLQKDFIGLRVDKQLFFRNNTSKKGIDKEEIEANKFAASLLIPETILTKIIFNKTTPFDTENEEDMSLLAKKFGVSISALSIRIGKLIKVINV